MRSMVVIPPCELFQSAVVDALDLIEAEAEALRADRSWQYSNLGVGKSALTIQFIQSHVSQWSNNL